MKIIILIILVLNCQLAISKEDNKISYIFRNAKLSEALSFALGANNKEVVGFKNIPDLTIKFLKGFEVSAMKLEQRLLKCGELELVPVDYYYQIKVSNKPLFETKDRSDVPYCNIFKGE